MGKTLSQFKKYLKEEIEVSSFSDRFALKQILKHIEKWESKED